MGYSSDYESDYACTESENWSPSPAVLPKVRGKRLREGWPPPRPVWALNGSASRGSD